MVPESCPQSHLVKWLRSRVCRVCGSRGLPLDAGVDDSRPSPHHSTQPTLIGGSDGRAEIPRGRRLSGHCVEACRPPRRLGPIATQVVQGRSALAYSSRHTYAPTPQGNLLRRTASYINFIDKCPLADLHHPQMPQVPLTRNEIADLAAYIMSLKGNWGPGPQGR